MLTKEVLEASIPVVRAVLAPTPQIAWPGLSRRLGTDLLVKHENHLPTGAFKVRGGLTYLDTLLRTKPEVRGLILATRGNHGLSLAFAAGRHSLPVTVVVPHGNSAEKNAAIAAMGAQLIEHGKDFDAAFAEAVRLSAELGLEMVPSFHDDLVAGVATYAHELFTAAPRLDRLYVSIGMGSGICGCIAVRDSLGLKTEIVGVQNSAANAYVQSIRSGRLVATLSANTRADGMAVRTPHPAALEVIGRGAADVVEVDDDAIAAAIRAYWTDTHNLAEGAGAAALAAALKERDKLAGKSVGVILSGGNIDLELFRTWVLDG